MGFFSGILGSGSDWDGANYVAKIVGKKLWHRNFIDMDITRQAGIAYAFETDPSNSAFRMAQSPKTIPGELMFLLKACEQQFDTVGAKNVARAMSDLLERHSDKISEFTEMKFYFTDYKEYLGEQKIDFKAPDHSELNSKQKLLDELCELIKEYIEADTLDEFLSGYVYLDELFISNGVMHVRCSLTEPHQHVYSLVKVADLKSLIQLEGALDLKPSMLNVAINIIGQEVIAQFGKDCLKFRELKEF